MVTVVKTWKSDDFMNMLTKTSFKYGGTLVSPDYTASNTIWSSGDGTVASPQCMLLISSDLVTAPVSSPIDKYGLSFTGAGIMPDFKINGTRFSKLTVRPNNYGNASEKAAGHMVGYYFEWGEDPTVTRPTVKFPITGLKPGDVMVFTKPISTTVIIIIVVVAVVILILVIILVVVLVMKSKKKPKPANDANDGDGGDDGGAVAADD